MSVKIIVDSSTDVSEETLKRLIMTPLTISFGEVYIDKVAIKHKEFYEKLVESDV